MISKIMKICLKRPLELIFVRQLSIFVFNVLNVFRVLILNEL